MRPPETENCQSGPEEKERSRMQTLPDFRQYCKAPEIEQSGPCPKTDTWTSGAEQKARNKPKHSYGQLIFDK